jgi:hypothetical protein
MLHVKRIPVAVVLIVRSHDKMARRWKGRNFRNKAEFRSSKSSASTGSGETAAMDTTALWLHWTTRRDVLRYLVHFRNACIAHYHEATTIQRGSSSSSSRQCRLHTLQLVVQLTIGQSAIYWPDAVVVPITIRTLGRLPLHYR